MSLLEIHVEGQDEISKVIESLHKAFDTTHILDEGAAIALYRIQLRFLQQVDPEGAPWIPSKAAARRAQRGRGGGTLFNTGRLFHSIQLAGGTDSERFIGTDVFYAPFHNEGTVKLPKREFMGFNEQDANVIERLVIRRIEEVLGALA